jgi:hypothetical protein
MNPLQAISLISILFYLPLYAQESIESTEPIEESIVVESNTITNENEVESAAIKIEESPQLQELIEAVKEAPDEEKRLLMNQLKIQLKNMNQELRHQAMMSIKESFSKKENNSKKRTLQKEKEYHTILQHSSHQPQYRILQHGATAPLHQQHRGEAIRHQGNGQK